VKKKILSPRKDSCTRDIGREMARGGVGEKVSRRNHTRGGGGDSTTDPPFASVRKAGASKREQPQGKEKEETVRRGDWVSSHALKGDAWAPTGKVGTPGSYDEISAAGLGE